MVPCSNFDCIYYHLLKVFQSHCPGSFGIGTSVFGVITPLGTKGGKRNWTLWRRMAIVKSKGDEKVRAKMNPSNQLLSLNLKTIPFFLGCNFAPQRRQKRSILLEIIVKSK